MWAGINSATHPSKVGMCCHMLSSFFTPKIPFASQSSLLIMPRTCLQKVRSARVLRSGRITVTPIVRRSYARYIPPSRHLLSTLKCWSKGGQHEQSQQSVDRLEETLAESGIESSYHADYLEADSDHMLTAREGENPGTLRLNVGLVVYL